MNKEETIIINDELFYRIPNGTSYDYAPIPKEFKPYFERLQQENKELKEDIDKLTSESTEWEDRYYRLQDKWDVSIIELENKNKELQKENQSLRTRIKTIKRRRKHQTQKLNKYKTVVTDLRNALEKKNNKIDKAIDVIHTQMKNNPSYKENLKIIENNLIKGSCRVCDLKDSDVDEL